MSRIGSRLSHAEQLLKSLQRDSQQESQKFLPTGLVGLDRFLSGAGLPRGKVCLFYGGPSAISLWSHCALLPLKEKKWVCWAQNTHQSLCPWFFFQKQMPLNQFIVVTSPADTKKLCWTLQEILSLSLFDLIGCQIDTHRISDAHILQFNKIARRFQTTLVLTSSQPHVFKSSFYGLILKVEPQRICIEKALHRPTPHYLERSDYANSLSLLSEATT